MYRINLPLFILVLVLVLVLVVCVISSVSDPVFAVVVVFVLDDILYPVTDADVSPVPTSVLGFPTVFVAHI